MVDPTTRRVERTPVTLKIKFKSETLDQFIERYAVDVSPGGIFIRTKEPLSVGTPMKFEFQLRDASPLIAGEGTVVWTRENDPSRPAVAPGMGVRFDRLAEGSQGVIDKILVEKSKQPSRPASDTAKPFMDMPTRVAPLPSQDSPRPHSPSKPFMDTPTRVAPLAMSDALFSGADRAQAAAQLPERPIPFQPDAGEFAPGAFEEATKVRSLDDLVAQTGHGALFRRPGPTPSNSFVASAAASASAAGELSSLRDQGSSSHLPIPPPQEPSSVLERTEPPPLPRRPPTAPPPRLRSNSAPPSMLAEHSATAAVEHGQPAFAIDLPPHSLAGSAAHPGGAGAIDAERAASPTERAKRTSSASGDIAGEKAPSAPGKRASRAPAFLGILTVAAAATAIWYFIFRDSTHDHVATPTEASDTTGTTVADEASSGSAFRNDVIHTAAAGDVAKPTLVETEIVSTAPKSIVTVVKTGQSGPAPFTAKLEKDKKYEVRIEAPGHAKTDIEVVGGQDKVTANPAEKPHVLIVSSQPDGAQVFINNAPTGKVTPATIELTASHKAKPRLRLQLRRNGYRWVDRIVEVTGPFTEDDAKMTLSIEVPLVATAATEGGAAKPEAAKKPAGAVIPDSAANPDNANDAKPDAAAKPEGTAKPEGAAGAAHPSDAAGERTPDTRDHTDPNKP